ncbi:hypothetical protein CAMRE0001_0021 [Campylobacter rectus RM3267]|uniref:Uncharacterized protein n=1 Tax=Campylobacter rectus RM3267 TaxID=553218 RepID=B9D3G6_CAMRE|nr:hypothetical protein CAMRE0001_0021 [Campylobacter rectus RM3267]
MLHRLLSIKFNLQSASKSQSKFEGRAREIRLVLCAKFKNGASVSNLTPPE